MIDEITLAAGEILAYIVEPFMRLYYKMVRVVK